VVRYFLGRGHDVVVSRCRRNSGQSVTAGVSVSLDARDHRRASGSFGVP
jgi:hypothetical protein